jgi:mannose-6-phosphate isomerase-like protein (cupin superfamily)
MGYSVLNIRDLEAGGPTGGVRFVRRELDLQAFGLNWFELRPNAEGYEHDETSSQQEEVNVVIEGGGRWRIDGEEIDVERGSVLRFDPETTRCPIAGPDGMTFVAIGARRGSYDARGPF